MPLNFENILGPHETALNMQARRAQILGANLANADTPGYKAQDIDFKSVLASAGDRSIPSSSMRITNSKHIEPEGYVFGAEMMYRVPMQASLDGNSVESQVEMAEFSENAMRYMMSLRVVNGRLNGILTAIKGE
ncbi:MAG: flagellar basal body rod protein FlgB [Gammaproteobacteria bacterium]|nr:flagellar basal body rod protein FlgB [Gammaproteobacteria bacterium]